MIELCIRNGDKIYYPSLTDSIVWETQRKGSPGKLAFTVLKDDVLDFQEGNHVSLRVDGADIFYGFVFVKSRDKKHNISVTAYDQLRYLKNKDSITYGNVTASALIGMLASMFNLNTGEIEDTGYVLPKRSEENTALFDIILTALEITLTNTGTMYVLYDDFGRLTLKSVSAMKTGVLINGETCENFDYSSSIDSNTYNRIKLRYDSKDGGKSETYVSQDSSHINDWGLLQYYDTVKNPENAAVKADTMLKMYNSVSRQLKIKNAFGNTAVRAGSTVPVFLNLGDMKTGNYFMVETCKHTFKHNEHFMNLTLRGGKFVG